MGRPPATFTTLCSSVGLEVSRCGPSPGPQLHGVDGPLTRPLSKDVLFTHSSSTVVCLPALLANSQCPLFQPCIDFLGWRTRSTRRLLTVCTFSNYSIISGECDDGSGMFLLAVASCRGVVAMTAAIFCITLDLIRDGLGLDTIMAKGIKSLAPVPVAILSEDGQGPAIQPRNTRVDARDGIFDVPEHSRLFLDEDVAGRDRCAGVRRGNKAAATPTSIVRHAPLTMESDRHSETLAQCEHNITICLMTSLPFKLLLL